MKTRSIGAWTPLLLFGAAIILLIGAFARFDSSVETGNLSAVPVAPPAPGLEPADATEAAGGPALPANLSPGLDEIIKLAQAHVGDDVILAFVQNSGRTYNPTSQELLYLTDLGLSQKVLAALYSTVGAAAPPESAETAANATLPPAPPDFGLTPPSPESPASSGSGLEETAASAQPVRDAAVSPPVAGGLDSLPLQDPTSSYFFEELAPYGSWIDLGEEGWFWQPTVSVTVIGWQPYRDHGGWSYTESGWFWRSDYSWAWAAFHYGRWLNNPRYGWVWRPGNMWAPAWVAWRNTSEYAGWAPLPPGAGPNVPAKGFSAANSILNSSSFTFVRMAYFLKSGMESFAVASSDVPALFRASAPVNNYTVSGDRIFNFGVSTSQIAEAIGRPVRRFALRDVSTSSAANQNFGRGVLAVYRPVISQRGTGSANGASRLAQLDASEAIPAREVPAADEPRHTENAAGVPRPGTPPPAIPGMHTLSLSPGAKQSVFPPGHFDGRFSPVEFDRPPRAGEPFGSREYEREPAANRPALSEGRPAQHYENAEVRPAPERPTAPDTHNTAPSASTSSSKK